MNQFVLQKTKYCILSLAFLLMGIFTVHAQFTLNTTVGSTGYDGTNGAGNGFAITFVIENTSTQSMILTDVGDWTINTDNGETYSLYYSSTSLSGAPPTSYPATGWTLAGQNTVTTITSTALSVNNVISAMNLIIPSNTSYRFALHTTGARRYSGSGVGTCTPNTFSNSGVSLYVGDYQIGGSYVGYGASNNPRFFTGSVSFIPATPCTGTPVAGIASGPIGMVCANSSFSLNLTGFTLASGISYQWQSKAASGSVWSDITGATSTSYNQASGIATATDYRAIVTCAGSSQSDTSNTVSVTVAPLFPGGTYTIDPLLPISASNFQTMAEAVSAISCGISSSVIFNMAAGNTFNEQITLPATIGTTATNTVIFNGNGDTVNNTGTATMPWTIGLDGADYITFNNLVVAGNGTYALVTHLWNDADHNNFNNCTFLAPENGSSTTQVPFSVSGSPTSGTTAGNSGSYNVLDSCTMFSGYYNTVFYGNATTPNVGNQVKNSTLIDFDYYGSYNYHQSGMLVKKNTIERPTRTTLGTFYGVYFSTGVLNSTIEQNRIRNQFGGNTTYSGTSYNIYVSSTSATAGNENKVINNVIGNFNGDGSAYGIYMPSAIYTQVYYNTVSIDNTAATTGTVYGIYSTGTTGGIDIKDNNISITQGGSGTKYALYFSSSANGKTSNYNNLYIGSTSGTNNIGYLSGAQASFAAWQAAGGSVFDQNSTNIDPMFTSATSGDFTPSNAGMDNLGTPIVGITTDFTGAIRSATTPDMGAYEFTVPPCSGTPTAGTAFGPSLICSGLQFTIQDTGFTIGAGITFQWEEQTTIGGPWTAIVGAATPTYTVSGITTPTSYRLAVTCTNGNSTVTSNAFLVGLNTLLNCYCIPPPPINGCSGDNIDSVHLGTLSDPNQSCTPFYEDRSSLQNAIPDITGGTSPSMSVSVGNGGTEYVGVWIDFDQNGTFDASEFFALGSGNNTVVTNNITIPIGGALVGNTKMRVRTRYNTAFTGTDACTSVSYGTTRDYLVNYVAAPPCAGIITAGTASGPTGVCSAISFTVNVIGNTAPATNLTGNWQSAPSPAGPWTDIVGATSGSYTESAGITSATSYRYWTTCSNNNSTDTSNVISLTINPANQCYCVPAGTTPSHYIDSFATSGGTTNITNGASGYATNGYGVYTSQTVTQVTGGTVGFFGQYAGSTFGTAIWVDWNHNGVLDDPGELVYSSSSYVSSQSGSFTVPTTALAGPTRMRIGISYTPSTGPATPCMTNLNGEYEDYTFVVTAPCTPPTVNLGADTSICAGQSLTLDAGNPTLTFLWNDNTTNQTLTVGTAGTYSVTVTDGACSASDTIVVGVTPMPVVNLGNDTTICQGQTLTLHAANAGASYLWNDNSSAPTLDVTTAGNYSVKVTNGNCVAGDTIMVSVDPLPSADTILAVNSGGCNFTFSAINPQNITSYSWTFGDGSPNDTNAMATHSYAENGSYLAVLTMTNDCGTTTITTAVNCTDVGIGNVNVSNDALKLYPNPTSDKITIENSINLNMEYIMVFNVLGQVVYQAVPQSAVKHQMNVSNLASGLYTVRIQTNEGMVVRKFEILK